MSKPVKSKTVKLPDAVSPLIHEVSTYIAAARKRKLPVEIAERAKLHLVDTFAAMISGTKLLPGKRGIAYVKSLGDRLQKRSPGRL